MSAPPAARAKHAIPPTALRGGRLPAWLAVGHFIARAPARLGRTELPRFLERLAREAGRYDERRIGRLSRRWLRVPGLRGRDTCYLRSLVLFRFLRSDGDVSIHFGIDEPEPNERLHGHSWVCVDGRPLNPPATLAQGRLREIYWYSRRRGGASANAAAIAAAMMSASAADPGPAPPPPA